MPTGIYEHRVKHGGNRRGKRTPEYSSWACMIQRCTNPRKSSWKHYGGRGIKVCDRWLNFDNFIQDMGNKPHPKNEIERINNNLGYEPSNCRWATRKEQASNTRWNVLLLFNGQSKTMSQWATELGFKVNSLQYRLSRGWTVEKALTVPMDQRYWATRRKP